jgi:DNA polymerase III subunit epsilon
VSSHPRQPTPTPAGRDSKVAIIIDFETTGLDAVKDEILEVAIVKFLYSNGGEVDGITGIFQAFNQPPVPILAEIANLTGITDAMVTGHRINAAALEGFVADANVLIAHSARLASDDHRSGWTARGSVGSSALALVHTFELVR